MNNGHVPPPRKRKGSVIETSNRKGIRIEVPEENQGKPNMKALFDSIVKKYLSSKENK